MTYDEFIKNILNGRGRFECGEEYHERHHITPKCMGGTNDQNNLIDLYAREHFEAHRLLALENPENQKLMYAWNRMCNSKNGDYQITDEEYEEARIVFSKSISGERHPMYGKHLSEDVKQKISEAHKGNHLSEEIRKKISKANKNPSEETRKKMGEANRGENNGMYGVNQTGSKNPFYGKHHSEESKHRMSVAKKEKYSGKNHPMYGKHLSEETKKKISISHKGEKNHQARKVAQYDLEGNLIRIWDYIKQAAMELNISRSSISECCSSKYKRKVAGGFKWFYAEDVASMDNSRITTKQNDYKEEFSDE